MPKKEMECKQYKWDDRDYMGYCAVLTLEQWHKLCKKHNDAIEAAFESGRAVDIDE